jgi:ribosomal protein L24E
MKRRYLLVPDVDGGNYRLIDKNKSLNERVVKLKADKRDLAWADDFRGQEACRITDDGNGLTWTTNDGHEFRFDYSNACELMILLIHLRDNGNYFNTYTKTEEV